MLKLYVRIICPENTTPLKASEKLKTVPEGDSFYIS